jgi:hypothetical protein
MSRKLLLTKDYIDAHRVGVQTFESFARSLIDITMIKAKEMLGNQAGAAAEQVTFPLKVTVRPILRQEFVAPNGDDGTAGDVVGGSGSAILIMERGYWASAICQFVNNYQSLFM